MATLEEMLKVEVSSWYSPLCHISSFKLGHVTGGTAEVSTILGNLYKTHF